MENYKVDSLREAIELATGFENSGKYNLFRGQRENWPVVSSLARIPQEKQEEVRGLQQRFDWWIQTTPGLEHYRDDALAMQAVAQHYGIPTTLVDFSASPEVAAFFAADGHMGDQPAVLICLNEVDFRSLVDETFRIDEGLDDVLRTLTFERPLVPNLWRMETQQCVFLNSRVAGSVEKIFYPLDRIFIRHPKDGATIDHEQIYPTRKSDLERLLDQFFSVELRLPAIEQLRTMVAMGAFTESVQMGNPGNCYLRLAASPHPSWDESKALSWTEGQIEVEAYPASSATLTIDSSGNSSQISDAINAGKISRMRTERFELDPPDPGMSAVLARLWDGLRRLPYANGQIATCMTRYIGIARGQAEAIPNPVEIEFGADDGSYGRSMVSEDRLAQAFRPDLAKIVKDEYTARIAANPRVALVWIPHPRMLFQFDEFVGLLAEDVLPSAMHRTSLKHAPFFSPWRISRFGLR